MRTRPRRLRAEGLAGRSGEMDCNWLDSAAHPATLLRQSAKVADMARHRMTGRLFGSIVEPAAEQLRPEEWRVAHDELRRWPFRLAGVRRVREIEQRVAGLDVVERLEDRVAAVAQAVEEVVEDGLR